MAFDREDKPFLGGVVLFCGLVLLASVSIAVGIAFGAPFGLSVIAFVMTIVLIAAFKAIGSIPEDEE